MLILANEVKQMSRFSNLSETDIERKLKKIEYAIRGYTHNDFLSKEIRFYAEIENKNIIPFSSKLNSYLKVNDTVLIKNEYIRDLYTIKEINDSGFTLKEDFVDNIYNLIIKVNYPFEVIEGALDVLEWDSTMRKKVGIKSESLSRHSITYYDNDSNNTINGYPVSLFGFLNPYKKVRT